jgi:hypothetical protein
MLPPVLVLIPFSIWLFADPGKDFQLRPPETFELTDAHAFREEKTTRPGQSAASDRKSASSFCTTGGEFIPES